MKRYLSVLFAIALLGTVSLTASAQVNVTIKPFGGLGGNFGNMATEIGYAVAPNLELVGGIDHGSVTVKIEVNGQFDSETIGVTLSETIGVTLFNVGGRYYFMKNGNLDTFVFGNIGFASMDLGEDVDEPTVRIYKLGLGSAYNISENWAVVGETGFGWINIKADDTSVYEDQEIEANAEFTQRNTFVGLGLKYSF